MQDFYRHAQRAIQQAATPMPTPTYIPTTATTVSTADLAPYDHIRTPWGTATIDHIDKAYTRKQNGIAIVFYRLYVSGICKRTLIVNANTQWLIG